MKRTWAIHLWADSKSEAVHEADFEGDFAGARARAEDLVDAWSDEGHGKLVASIRPTDVELECLPAGWRVDEERGELARATPGPIADPLPHVAVRVMKGGAVLAILEPGLQRSRHALQVVATVVPVHLGSAKRVSLEAVRACQRGLEEELARLAARRAIRSTPTDGGRTWT